MGEALQLARARRQPPLVLVQLPEDLQSERAEPLRRVLRGLPDPILDSLLAGLNEADELTDGTLFSGDSGGCAVGVLMRALFPAYRDPGGIRCRIQRMRRKQLSIVQVRPDIARQIPHLYSLEQVFDRTVLLASERMPDASREQVLGAVGRWLAIEVQTVLQMRELGVRYEEMQTSAKPTSEKPETGATRSEAVAV